MVIYDPAPFLTEDKVGTWEDEHTTCTEVEVFMENGVRGRARTAGANSRRDATKKHEISLHIFPINLHS